MRMLPNPWVSTAAKWGQNDPYFQQKRRDSLCRGWLTSKGSHSATYRLLAHSSVTEGECRNAWALPCASGRGVFGWECSGCRVNSFLTAVLPGMCAHRQIWLWHGLWWTFSLSLLFLCYTIHVCLDAADIYQILSTVNHLPPPERKTAILMEGSIPCEIISMLEGMTIPWVSVKQWN